MFYHFYKISIISASTCQVGFTGHNCKIELDDEAECQYDHDCPESQFCNPNGAKKSKTTCDDPCQYACHGYGADCEVVDHKAICTCGSQWSGNPDPYVVKLIGFIKMQSCQNEFNKSL